MEHTNKLIEARDHIREAARTVENLRFLVGIADARALGPLQSVLSGVLWATEDVLASLDVESMPSRAAAVELVEAGAN